MSRALLDTHSFLWFVTADPKLSATAARLIAQALTEGLPIVSVDPAFDSYPVKRLW